MEALRTVCPAWLMDIMLATVEAIEILVPLLTLESTLLLALWDCFAKECCNTSVLVCARVCGRSINMSINDYVGDTVCLSITRKRIHAGRSSHILCCC